MTTLTPQEFFSRVWPARLVREEKLELRARNRQTGKVSREFYDSIPEFIKGAQSYKNLDVYFGITTRYGRGGKKKDCYRINTLWVDFDQGKTLDDCMNLSPLPNILVNSGGGVHAYWLLSSTIVVRDADRVKQVEAVTRGLAQKFSGDTQTIDITRILRVPGHLNYKYDPPRSVKAHLLKSEPYSIDYFKRMGIYIEKTDDPGDYIGTGGVISDLPLKIKSVLEHPGGPTYGGDFSRQDSAIITAMLSSGISPEDTYSTFAASPRGQHAKERKADPEDYLQRTIRKAVSFITSRNGNSNISIDFGKKLKLPEGDGIIAHRASQVEVETTRWLWPGYIPAGKITILAGDPGNGKSTIGIDLASRISRGTFLPFEPIRADRGNCLVASAEDAAADTIVPRLIASRADLSRVETLRQVMIDGEPQYLSFPRDLNTLHDFIVKRGARFVVIDPMSAFLSGEVDSYRDQDIRRVLAPVENIAEETGAAILIIAHLNKKEEGTIMYRIGGSIGIIGAARSVLAVQKIPDKTTRVLYSIKSNLAKQPPALEYDISGVKRTRSNEEGWIGEAKIDSSAIRWMARVDFDPMQGAVNSRQAEDETRSFLRQVIYDSEASADEIFKEARSAGISKGQLIRTKEAIGIKPKRHKNGKWYWSWPEKPS